MEGGCSLPVGDTKAFGGFPVEGLPVGFVWLPLLWSPSPRDHGWEDPSSTDLFPRALPWPCLSWQLLHNALPSTWENLFHSLPMGKTS